jgi:hypothetical protein
LKNFLQLFPGLFTSVIAIEQAVGPAVPGASKKQILLDSVSVAAKIGEAIPIPQVALISGLIDQIVASLHTAGVFTHAAKA